MDVPAPLALRLRCPFSGADGYRSDGFVGVWSPRRGLAVECHGQDPACAAFLAGGSWFLCSPVASGPAGPRPKIHADPDADRGLAFRGYVVDPPLHHFSAPADLWKLWERGGGRYPNGIFATAFIEGRTNRLILKTDAFGFSPLYYRTYGDLVLFGTKPDLLLTGGFEYDEVAAASVMGNNHPVGDRTLFRGIERCPFGTALRFDGSVEPAHETWFGADDLPPPDRPLSEDVTRELQALFVQSVGRCTALEYGATHLPLSSGHDSRRLLGALLEDGTAFTSSTVRIYEKGARDLDGRYAAELAHALDFPHEVVELPPADEYAWDDARRRFELCAETWMHRGWTASLMRSLPAEPTMLVDGFLGDVLDNPGYRLAGATFYEDPEADLEAIAEDVAATKLWRHLSDELQPKAQIRDEVRRYLAPLSSKRNLAELAYVLLRQRRGTALWSQQFVAPEHLVVCPYADLDYVSAMMAVRPEDREAFALQRAALQQYYPDLARIAGSRDFPPDLPATGETSNRERSSACIRRLTHEVGAHRAYGTLMGRLSPLGRSLAVVARASPDSISRWHWMLRATCEVLVHDRKATAVWHFGAERASPSGR